MERDVMVGFDGSASASEAVRWAAHAASSRGASLRIVACFDVPVDSPLVPLSAGLINGVVEAAEAGANEVLAAMLREHPGLRGQATVIAGSAAGVLARESAGAALLVVGASGHHGASAFWLGSTARSVARHSTCPVVVVRSGATIGVADRIVVAVDGSSQGDSAALWAADEAARIGAPLHVVHGWWYVYRPEESWSRQGHDIARVDAALLLEQAVERARERSGAEVTGELLEQAPVDALLGAVRDGDLLVVGAPHHGQIVSSIVGSTVDGVLEAAAVPVVIVRGAVAERPPATRPAAREGARR
jgi:nucleotide-binding universal stress UspA family protein